ncbi:caspase family protein [Anabaena azotica]|uniref:caspase family protein n=1 Tax=Anabaena azotica TaxID=197653 RepID=UPI0039A4A931
MPKNWAIAIGINRYEFLQPLNYAKRDAEVMQQFFANEAGFNRVLFFSDDSPDIDGKSTRPSLTNLLRIFRQMFETPFMTAGDNFWFFFSGHGIRYADRDYLMPCDGDPGDVEKTAIAISYISERLRRCGADNVVLILDACRNQGNRSGVGIGDETATQAKQTGIISIFSCSPNELSYEVDTLQQGTFTYALLEGLGTQGKCATVERLNQYLSHRVPELNRQYGKPRQNPYTIAEPVTKSHLILLPQYATLHDISTLKNDAYQAEVSKNIDLAEQLWIRVLAVASGQDLEAIKSLQRIERVRIENSKLPWTLTTKNQNQDQIFGVKSIYSIISSKPKPSTAKIFFTLYQSIGVLVVLSSIFVLFSIREKFVILNSKIHPSPSPSITETSVLRKTQDKIQVSPNSSTNQENSSASSSGFFYCGVINNTPATIYQSSTGNELAFILWVSTYFNDSGNTPQKRCQEVSSRFQRLQSNGTLNYIVPGYLDGYQALCASKTSNNPIMECRPDNLIMLLRPSDNPTEIINNMTKLNNNISSKPIKL